MPADPSQLAALLLSLLATYVFHSTCLLLGVGFYFALHRAASAAWRNALWKFAALAGFVTAPAALCLSVAVPVTHVVAESAAEEPVVAARSAEAPRETFDEPADFAPMDAPPMIAESSPPFAAHDEPRPEAVPELHDAKAAFTPSVAALPPEMPKATPTPSARWRMWAGVGLLALAACCGLLGFTRLCGQSVVLWRRFSDCRPLSVGPAAEELAQLMQQRYVRCPIRLLESPGYAEPAAFGLWRWSIVLPQRAESDLNRRELRSLLAHELAHLVRRDGWWLLIGRLLCTAFAYQPLNFWARRQWQHATEFLCDEWAVRCTGDRLSLAKCLTAVAQWRVGRGGWSGALAVTGRRSMLTARVEKLIDDRDDLPSSPMRSFATALTAVTAVAALIIAGPTATFALPAWKNNQPAEPLETVLLIEATAAAPSTALAPTDIDAAPAMEQVESPDDWSALREDLSILNNEIRELQSLLNHAENDPQLAAQAARLRQRIHTIEEQTQRLKQLFLAVPMDAGAAIVPSPEPPTTFAR